MLTNEIKKQREDKIDENLAILEAVDKEQRTLTPEEQTKYDENEQVINKLDANLDLSERRARMQGYSANKSAPKTGPMPVSHKQNNYKLQSTAFKGWLKSWYAPQNSKITVTAEERSAMEACGTGAGRTNFVVRNNFFNLANNPEQMLLRKEAEARSMTEGTWAFTGSANPLFSYYNIGDLIQTAMLAYGNLGTLGDVFTTPTAFVLPIATTNDTSTTSAIIAEEGALTPADLAAQSTINFNAYKLATSIVFSQELLSDTAGEGFPLESYLSGILGERMARGEEHYFAVGNGTSAPQGLTVGASNSNVTLGGTSAAPTWSGDNLIDLLEGSIDPLYMQDDSYGVMAHQKTVVAWRKIKDTTGRYLWQDGGQLSGFDKKASGYIEGVPVFMNNSFPIPGTQNNVLAVAGPMKKFKIRRVNQIEFFVNPYLYSLTGQILLQCWERVDSKVMDAGTKPLQYVKNP